MPKSWWLSPTQQEKRRADRFNYNPQQLKRSWDHVDRAIIGLRASLPAGIPQREVLEMAKGSILVNATRMLLENNVEGAREYALGWYLLCERLKKDAEIQSRVEAILK